MGPFRNRNWISQALKRRRNIKRPPITTTNQPPAPPPVEPPELLEEDEELLDELEELLVDELLDEELVDDELLLDEELELEDEELLLVDFFTRMELRVPLSLTVVTLISSLPSVTFASKVFFNTVLAPTSVNISTLLSTFWPSIATLKERCPASVQYISTKPNSTDTRWLLIGMDAAKVP